MYKEHIGRPLDDEIEGIIDDVVERHHGTVKVFNDNKIDIKMGSGIKTIGHKGFYITYIHGTPD